MGIVEFRKDSESIPHKWMLTILKAYGIPKLLVLAIQSVYEKFKARVTCPDGETDYFKIDAGIMKEDTLALFLFLFYSIMQWERQPRKRRGT